MTAKRSYRKTSKTFAPVPSTEKLLKEFGSSTDLTGLNSLLIGVSVFETEQVLRSGQIRKVIIPLYISNEDQYDLKTIGELIHELLIFTVAEDIEVQFRPLKTQFNFDYKDPQLSSPSVCLFSGGTDSYAGVLLAQEALGNLVGVFCAHADQARIIHIVKDLQEGILQSKGIDLIKVGVPRIEARGYAQLRGFLYLLSGTVVAHKFGSDRLVVTECGPTMYQPRFSPLDSITMTTHPFVVRTAVQVASLMLNRQLKVITPFENLTKAEVIAICPEKQGLKYTHSCITQRFGTHDGTCYGCVIRRLAAIAADVEDVKYNRNPITDSRARAGNLFALLDFCYHVLTGFSEMEEYERGIVDTYRKRDLFQRFALDNFAAIHKLLSEKKRVVGPVLQMYKALTEKLGTQVFEDRLKYLAHSSAKPNFKKLAK
jgi:7-cyano-7-deazaguanine synthase in queuosine biosynthesis